MSESGPHNRRNSKPRTSGEKKADLQLAKLGTMSNMDLIKQLDTKAVKQGKKRVMFSLSRNSQVSLLQLREVLMLTGVDLQRNTSNPILSIKPSPPRSATPLPTTSGLSFSKGISDGLNKTNELLNQEVRKLRVQVETLKSRSELQESELKQSVKKAQEAMKVAAEESAKCKAAKDVIKSLTSQLKDMAEKLPPGAYDPNSLKLIYLPNGSELKGTRHTSADGESSLRSEAINSSYSELLEDASVNNESSLNTKIVPNVGANIYEDLDGKESVFSRQSEGGLKARNSVVHVSDGQIEAEWIEQYEPGVYITLVALWDGTRDLKRVRFSRRRFGEHQAETWWSENRDSVYQKYNVRASEQSSARRSERALSPSSQF